MEHEQEKLNFKQLILLSKILKKMELKGNLTDFIFGNSFDSLLKSMDCDLEDKHNMIFINIAVFFIENIYLAEKEVFELISMINNVEIKEVEKYTIDEILPVVFKIMSGSFPKTINMILTLNIEHFKKKMFIMLGNINKAKKEVKKKNI